MLDLSLFRKPAFNGASIAAFSLSAAMFAMFLYLTLYVQNALGYSALEAGLRFLPVTLLSFLVAPLSGKLAERYGVRWFIAGGLALVGAGLLLMRRIEPGDDWTALLAGFMVAGGGIGAVNPALATAAIGVVEPHRSGMASGINSTFRQVGIATGTAALGAVFTHVVNGQATAFGVAVARADVEAGGDTRAGQFSDFISFGGFRQLGGGRARGARRPVRVPRGPAPHPALRRHHGARLGGAVRAADPPLGLRRARGRPAAAGRVGCRVLTVRPVRAAPRARRVSLGACSAARPPCCSPPSASRSPRR